MGTQPNQFQGSGITVEETGREMYVARWSTGLPWKRIAEDFGVSENVANQYARRFAIRFGAIWPIKKQVKMVRTELKGKKVYEAACMLVISNPGVSPFNHLGIMLGLTTNTVRAHARAYARMNEKPWPIPTPYVPSWGEISYELRDGTDCKMSWVEIQGRVGFKHTTHCIAAARKWAQKNGLPWPIQRRKKCVWKK